MDADFVVVWQSWGLDGSGNGIFARRYAAEASALSNEFLVNSFTLGNQQNPSVAVNPAGYFVIAWDGAGQDGSGLGVFAQAFDADGGRIGAEFLVNSYRTNDQSRPSATISNDNQFIVAWQSVQDGSFEGIYAHRYLLVPALPSSSPSAPAGLWLSSADRAAIETHPAGNNGELSPFAVDSLLSELALSSPL